MLSGHSKRRFVSRVVPAALAVQCLSVLVLPIALCCCLEMSADATKHDSEAHAGHEALVDDPCPHHVRTAQSPESSGGSEAGCSHVDQFVLLLSGMIGVSEAGHVLSDGLAAVPVGSSAPSALVDIIIPTYTPPPRA